MVPGFHSGLPSDLLLETDRLLLRPLEPTDLDAWWKAIWSDAEVTRFLPTRGPVPREAMPRRMERMAAHWNEHGIGVWAVRTKDDGPPVGHCGLIVNEPPDVELVYALGRAAWGRGFATEAAGRVARFAFEVLRLERLFALVFPENVASARVLEKVGFAPLDRVSRFGTELERYVLRR